MRPWLAKKEALVHFHYLPFAEVNW